MENDKEKIAFLEKELGEVRHQLREYNLSVNAKLAAHNEVVNKKLEDYNRELKDTATEAHKIKHSIEGLNANFVGFTRVFDKMQEMLTRIHENLLTANYEKRIALLEKNTELMDRTLSTTNLDKRVARLEGNNESLRSEIDGVSDKITISETRFSATLDTIKLIGIGQIIAFVVGIGAAVFKFMAK